MSERDLRTTRAQALHALDGLAQAGPSTWTDLYGLVRLLMAVSPRRSSRALARVLATRRPEHPGSHSRLCRWINGLPGAPDQAGPALRGLLGFEEITVLVECLSEHTPFADGELREALALVLWRSTVPGLEQTLVLAQRYEEARARWARGGLTRLPGETRARLAGSLLAQLLLVTFSEGGPDRVWTIEELAERVGPAAAPYLGGGSAVEAVRAALMVLVEDRRIRARGADGWQLEVPRAQVLPPRYWGEFSGVHAASARGLYREMYRGVLRSAELALGLGPEERAFSTVMFNLTAAQAAALGASLEAVLAARLAAVEDSTSGHSETRVYSALIGVWPLTLAARPGAGGVGGLPQPIPGSQEVMCATTHNQSPNMLSSCCAPRGEGLRAGRLNAKFMPGSDPAQEPLGRTRALGVGPSSPQRIRP